MLKFIKTLSWFLTALAFITLMVVNRDIITVHFWPLPYEAEIPVFFVFFVGALVGILGTWLVGMAGRIETRFRSKPPIEDQDEEDEFSRAMEEIENQDSNT